MSIKSTIAPWAALLVLVAVQPVLAAGNGSPAADTLQEVTVTAHHRELVQRVETFVNQIAAVANAEGLPRWQRPMCPLVSGLARQDGEFILGRVTEVAQAAGVPLAGEHCNPNLYILVSLEPQQLLQAMAKRNYGFTFGYPPDAPPPNVIDRFIATPRPVRVWYTSQERDLEGWTLIRGPQDEPPMVPAPGSLLMIGSMWSLERVFVVIDKTRLQGVTRGQLADYVGMVPLADLKPGANLGDAATILRLFDGAPGQAPASMTNWDQAFLKSLYATDQKMKLQRSQIAHQMVHEIDH
jgi:hypothetical protein